MHRVALAAYAVDSFLKSPCPTSGAARIAWARNAGDPVSWIFGGFGVRGLWRQTLFLVLIRSCP